MITIFNPLTSKLNLNKESVQPHINTFFGSGSDGDLTLTTGTNVTIQRDMFYRNVTLTASQSLNLNSYKLFVSGTLDISNLTTAQIFSSNGTAGNASGSTGGTGSPFPTAKTIGGSAGSVGGTAGGTGITTANGRIQATAITAQITSLGGSNGASGGGGITTGSIDSRSQVLSQINSFYRVDHQILRGSSLFGGGLSGQGGTSGGGDGTNPGAGGGGGGAGGGVIVIFANTINRSSSTPAGTIRAMASNGGNGAASTLGTTGGGGGGSGGGGGVVIIYFLNLIGSSATNCIYTFGGNGGNGGNSVTSTRSAGQGGQGGSGGRIILFDLKNNTITEVNETRTHAAVPATIAAGDQVGGTGTTGTQTQASL